MRPGRHQGAAGAAFHERLGRRERPGADLLERGVVVRGLVDAAAQDMPSASWRLGVTTSGSAAQGVCERGPRGVDDDDGAAVAGEPGEAAVEVGGQPGGRLPTARDQAPPGHQRIRPLEDPRRVALADEGAGLVQHGRPAGVLDDDRGLAHGARRRSPRAAGVPSGAARVAKLARSASPTSPSRSACPPRSASARQTLTPLPPVVTWTAYGRATDPASKALDPQGAVEAEVRGDDKHG